MMGETHTHSRMANDFNCIFTGDVVDKTDVTLTPSRDQKESSKQAILLLDERHY